MKQEVELSKIIPQDIKNTTVFLASHYNCMGLNSLTQTHRCNEERAKRCEPRTIQFQIALLYNSTIMHVYLSAVLILF